MKIFIFGAKKCRHCSDQVEYLNRSFPKDIWTYVDVSSGKDLLKIAQEVNVDGIPSTMVLDDDWNVKYRTEGTICPDVLYYNFYPDSKNRIPFSRVSASLLRAGKISSALLSHERSFGDHNFAVDYGNKEIFPIKISSITKVSGSDIASICHPEQVEDYIKTGGRKDWAQLITFVI